MNNKRRSYIKNCITRLEFALKELNKILDDEQDSFDNIPDNLQSSLRASESEDAIDSLSEAIDSLEDCINILEDI